MIAMMPEVMVKNGVPGESFDEQRRGFSQCSLTLSKERPYVKQSPRRMHILSKNTKTKSIFGIFHLECLGIPERQQIIKKYKFDQSHYN